MEIRSLSTAAPFTTKDGSTIRELLGVATAPVLHQSLAEATVAPGSWTARHYHRASEEFYFVLEGRGEVEVGTDTATVEPGDAVLIPPGAGHRIRALGAEPLRFLCCCSPPYRHEDTVLVD